MRTRARILSAGAISLSLAVGLAGCSPFSAGPGEKDVREVNLAALPTLGMKLSYHVRTIARVSGAGVRSLPESEKSASVSDRYVVEVTAVGKDSFDLRVTGNRLQGVVVARFGRDWTALRFGVESGGQYADADLTTFPILGEAFQAARDLSGRWTVGEARPWERSVNLPPALRVRMKGTAVFKRITRLEGRRAAEFQYDASGEGEYAGSRLRMSLSGQSWVDLATGFMLQAKSSAPGQFVQADGPVLMELKEERTLDRSESAGL